MPICDANYILRALEKMAKVEKISILSYKSDIDGEYYLSAYIDVYKWNTNDYTKGFIKLLKSPRQKGFDVYLYHNDDMWWPIREIKNNVAMNYGLITYYGKEYYDTQQPQQTHQTHQTQQRQIQIKTQMQNRADTEWLTMTYYLSKKCAECIL